MDVVSAVLGAVLGLAYGVSSVLIAAHALRQDTRTFMVLYFGGMGVRLLLALVAVGVVTVRLRVDVPAFVAALLLTLILSLVLEILWLVRRRPVPV